MKKLVATAAAAALLGSAAFAADVKIGGWGRGAWVTGSGVNDANDGNDIYTSVTKSWGDTGPRVGMNLGVTTDNIGVYAEFHAEEQKWATYKMWWTPSELLKVTYGNTDNYFRGDAVYGMWDIFRVGVVDCNWDYSAGNGDSYKAGSQQQQEEGWTFMSHSGDGVQLYSKPIENLQLVATFCMPLENKYGSLDDASYKASANLKNVLGRQSKFAAAYGIDGVGTVKVGLEEKTNVATKDGEKAQNILNVAFDLTAVENLTVSVGAFVPLVQKTVISNKDGVKFNGEEVGWGNQVNLFAKYKADALTISGRVGTIIGTYDQKAKAGETSGIESTSGAFGFLVGAGVEYAVADGLSVIGEVDYANGIYNKRSSADKLDVIDFGIGLKKGYSNGNICVAFEGTTHNNVCKPAGWNTYKDDDFGWCVPVCIEYYF